MACWMWSRTIEKLHEMMIVVLPVGIVLVLLCNAWFHEVLRVEKVTGIVSFSDEAMADSGAKFLIRVFLHI